MKKNKKDFLCLILYKILLDLSYYYLEVKIFGYVGFNCDAPRARILVSWFTIISFYLIMTYKEKNDLCHLFLWTMLFLDVVPFSSLYQFADYIRYWMFIAQILGFIIIKIIFTFKSSKAKNHYLFTARQKELWIIFGGVILLFAAWAFVYFGAPSLANFTIDTIAEIRSEVEIGLLMNIIQTIVCKIIIPLCITVAMIKKKYIYVILLILIGFYSFIVTGFKTYLFVPIIIFGITALDKLPIKTIVIWGLLSIILLIDVLYFIGYDYPFKLIGDRVIFFPAQIKYAFFDYFSTHQFVYFSQNSFASIFGIESNYDIPVFNIIGDVYFNKPNMWTNTGFLADAYSNLGIPGLIIFAIIVGLVIKTISKKTDNISIKAQHGITAISILYFISLHDGAFLTTFLSGGMIILLFCVEFIDFRRI